MGEQNTTESDIETLIDRLKTGLFDPEVSENYTNATTMYTVFLCRDPNETFKKFTKLSEEISSYLPQLDESLTDIDDLIYPGDNMKLVTSTNVLSEASCQKLANACLNQYMNILENFCVQSSAIFLNRQTHTTCLQLFINCTMELEDWEINNFLNKIESFLTSMNLNILCLTTKLLRVVREIKHDMFQDHYSGHFNIFLHIKNLTNIPQPNHPDKIRIASWLRSQIAVILQNLNLNDIVKESEYREFSEEIDEGNLETFAYYMSRKLTRDPYLSSEQVLKYFLSAKHEDDKLKRLKYFLKGCIKVRSERKEIDEDSIGETLSDYLFHAFHLIKERYPFKDPIYGTTDDRLKAIIEKYIKYDFKPYLSINDGGSYNIAVRGWTSNNDYIEVTDVKISKEDENCSEDPDFTIEQFVFFDPFMRYLHLMNIIHTASLNWEQMLELEEGSEEDISETFRDHTNSHIKWFIEALIKPTKRVGIPWCLDVMVKKCPFFFVSSNLEYILDDLVKMLKGEPIDEVTEERLYFALEDICHVYECSNSGED